MAAAERLILERGPEEVSIPDVAEASGVPTLNDPSAVYSCRARCDHDVTLLSSVASIAYSGNTALYALFITKCERTRRLIWFAMSLFDWRNKYRAFGNLIQR